MPRFLLSSKNTARLLWCKRQPINVETCGGMLGKTRSSSSSRPIGEYAQVRWLGSIAGIPSSNKLVDNTEKEFGLLPIYGMHNAVQNRRFLGVGDGEEGNPLSKTYEERRVMGYSQEQLFAVVAAVDMYDEFLPWCQRSQIVRRHVNGSFDAELEIGFKFLVESYVSHVELKKPERVKSTVTESGLFDHLINVWEFSPGPVPGSCDLHFYVDFKFQSPLYRQVATIFFKEVVARLVSSFNDRCRLIYGPAVRVLENSYGEQKA